MTHFGPVLRACLVVAAVAGSSAWLAAQADGDVVAADALQCWWRTSTSAVRVGEPFSLVLTCAVLDTDDVRVVADESRLDPRSMQLPPFDVLDGRRGPDFTDGSRRFFQYDYALRLIADDRFGKDVKLPPLAISYRIRSRSIEGTLSEGRDQTYELPSTSMRILSTVPEDAADIRDGGTALFEEIDGRLFRGTVLRAVGAVCLAVSAFALLMTVAAVLRRDRRKTSERDRRIPAWLVHRGIAAELAAVKGDRNGNGWRPELADRALAAARIVAARALDIPLTVVPLRVRDAAPRGTVAVRAGVRPEGRWVAVSSSVTARTVADAHARTPEADSARLQLLADVERALTVLTAAGYGRDARLDETALDGALATAMVHVRGGWSGVVDSIRNPRWTTVPLSVHTKLGSD